MVGLLYTVAEAESFSASASPEKAGYMAVKLLEHYSGKVYPVNPNAETILGHRVYSSLGAIGEPVDLVILAVPANLCPDLLRESAAINAGSSAQSWRSRGSTSRGVRTRLGRASPSGI